MFTLTLSQVFSKLGYPKWDELQIMTAFDHKKHQLEQNMKYFETLSVEFTVTLYHTLKIIGRL